MKPRPPSLRDKRRYILVRIFPPWNNRGTKDLLLAIHEAVTSASGDATASEVQMAVVYASGEFAIVRCNRGTEKVLEQALATVFCIGVCPSRCARLRLQERFFHLRKELRKNKPWAPI